MLLRYVAGQWRTATGRSRRVRATVNAFGVVKRVRVKYGARSGSVAAGVRVRSTREYRRCGIYEGSRRVGGGGEAAVVMRVAAASERRQAVTQQWMNIAKSIIGVKRRY